MKDKLIDVLITYVVVFAAFWLESGKIGLMTFVQALVATMVWMLMGLVIRKICQTTKKQ